MALDSKHPKYAEMIAAWIKMRHCYSGEDAVKMAGQIYLAPTPGQNLDGMELGGYGRANYDAYKMRAVYPAYVGEAVKAMIGVMHHKPPVIEVPNVMKPLLERATLQGESAPLLLRRINEQQLITGRIGLMLDLASNDGAAALPYIATYDAEHILNWDDGSRDALPLQTLNLVVLNETESEMSADFEWQTVEKFRVLVLGDPATNEAAGIYRQGLFRDKTAFNVSELLEPSIRGKVLSQLPFVFVNSTDLLPEPINPPLLQLANLCLTIYRGEADYRQNLFLQSQDTFVTVGAVQSSDDKAPVWRLGAGGAVNLPIGGDARFEGVTSDGLPEQRQSLENDRQRASSMGAQLLDTTSRSKESGEALKVRVAAQTATLNQVALAGAEGLQSILRIAAEWIGADPNAVIVKPNLDFADGGMTPADFLALANAKQAGLPLSDESLHQRLVADEYTNLEFAAEMRLLDAEAQKRAANAPQPIIVQGNSAVKQ